MERVKYPYAIILEIMSDSVHLNVQHNLYLEMWPIGDHYSKVQNKPMLLDLGDNKLLHHLCGYNLSSDLIYDIIHILALCILIKCVHMQTLLYLGMKKIINQKIIYFLKFGCTTHGSRNIVFCKYTRIWMEWKQSDYWKENSKF